MDVKGFVALWREGILAQKVLRGKTKGWKNHPQLNRFKKHPNPVLAIGTYLRYIYEESKRRDYEFNENKIYQESNDLEPVKVSRDFVSKEIEQLKEKLKTRDPEKHEELLEAQEIELNPAFQYEEE